MKKYIYVFTSLLIILTGCKANNESLQNAAFINEKNGTVIINSGSEKTYSNINKPQEQDIKHVEAEERAGKISDEIKQIGAVKKAAVAVTGNTAIIGLTLKEELSDAKLIELKKEVEKTVKKTDAQIEHVAVSSAPDLFERISNLSGTTDDDNEKEELPKSEDNDANFMVIPTL